MTTVVVTTTEGQTVVTLNEAPEWPTTSVPVILIPPVRIELPVTGSKLNLEASGIALLACVIGVILVKAGRRPIKSLGGNKS